MGLKEDALKLHKKLKGKIEIKSKIAIKNSKILSLLYTPGVAEVSKEIVIDRNKVYDYTSKGNSVAIVTDGSRVLGLGNVGPEAALPVMEGKALLMKLFGNIDAFPICLNTQDTEEVITAIKNISPSFGAINIEDIDSPKCFEVVERLSKELDIPIYHDDQHGIGIVTAAALLNSLKLVKKNIQKIKLVIAGAGAAGTGIVKILSVFHIPNIIVVDSKGAIYEGREDLDKFKEDIAKRTNVEKIQGSLDEVINEADVFVGVTGRGNIVNKNFIKRMNKKAIVFALSNPDPEILPDEAKKGGVSIIATGRSDYSNQINNSLIFPGILRGALDAGATKINYRMMMAATFALANLTGRKISKNHILPKTTDVAIHKKIAQSVYRMAIETKITRNKLD